MTGGERQTITTAPDTMILSRATFTAKTTLGDLWLDSIWQMYTLEPTCEKQPDVKLAIPMGRFEIVMYDSPRMLAKVARWKAEGQVLHPVIAAARVPLLLKVPGHDFVEMHPGNSLADTHDCILPGFGKAVDYVSHSQDAFIHLVPLIEAKLKAGKFYLGIIGGGPTV